MGNVEKGYFVGDDKYYCCHCEKVKHIKDFVKDNHNPKGFKSRCKECFSEYKRKWRKDNKEDYQKYYKERWKKKKNSK